ncbi:MAG: TIGR00282 family metallophosphoesterase [Candidatus Izemoplasma sp.]|nr:TIGR00282 family metallophosphoesterase [Candidatus Izemoplasma sp.]
MRICMVGDVFGNNGLKALKQYLPQVKEQYRPDLLIVNGENLAGGFGLTKALYDDLKSMHIHVITMGNHTFSKREIMDYMDDATIIRPLNYGEGVPGKGIYTFNYNGETVAVINLMGRIFMGDPLKNPFTVIDDTLKTLDTDHIIIDFHGEATSEKLAFGHHVDGRVTAVFGTHTHVPTKDAMRLPKGTFYITDIGMTGSRYSILGAQKDKQIQKFISGMPARIEEDKSDVLQFNAVLIDTDQSTIKHLQYFSDERGINHGQRL